MTSIKTNLAALVLVTFSSVVFGDLILNNGVPVNDSTSDNLSNSSREYAAIRTTLKKAGKFEFAILNGFTALNQGSGTFFAFLSDSSVHSIKYPEKQYLGGWPLYNYSCDATKPCNRIPWWNGRWTAEEFLEQDIIDKYPTGEMAWKEISQTDDTIMGCMRSNPLRYGDIDGDGTQELVVLLAQGYSVDLLIFSTALHKTIFATKVDYNDVIQHETLQSDPEHAATLPEEVEKQYQFWKRSGADEFRKGAMAQAARSFAKLYVGHYASETSKDILVWRKLYESNLISNPVKGFTKKSDTYAHYKLVNGEYKKQTTDTATIKGWLAAKQLTWKKGYPSKSECAGQEGQYIPEIHDPLLNDPDVLQ